MKHTVLPVYQALLLVLARAAHLHSPGRAPDIWRGVKSSVLSGFLLKLEEANTEIFNAESSIGRFSFAERERISKKEREGNAK